MKGTGRFVDANHVEITPADGTPYTIEADVALVSTRVRRWTGRMDWSDTAGSRARLEATNAFLDANDAEDRGFHLLDPVTDNPALNSRTPD